MTTIKSNDVENNSSNISTSRESHVTNSNEPVKTSVICKELISFCDKNASDDYLLVKKGNNPYKPTKKMCCMP